MLVDQQMRGMLDRDAIKELCERWHIPYEETPSTRTLILASTLGPIDPDNLPTQMEARRDIQRLVHTYMRQSHLIIQTLWDEED